MLIIVEAGSSEPSLDTKIDRLRLSSIDMLVASPGWKHLCRREDNQEQVNQG